MRHTLVPGDPVLLPAPPNLLPPLEPDSLPLPLMFRSLPCSHMVYPLLILFLLTSFPYLRSSTCLVNSSYSCTAPGPFLPRAISCSFILIFSPAFPVCTSWRFMSIRPTFLIFLSLSLGLMSKLLYNVHVCHSLVPDQESTSFLKLLCDSKCSQSFPIDNLTSHLSYFVSLTSSTNISYSRSILPLLRPLPTLRSRLHRSLVPTYRSRHSHSCSSPPASREIVLDSKVILCYPDNPRFRSSGFGS